MKRRPGTLAVLAALSLAASLPSPAPSQTIGGRLLDASTGTAIALGRVTLVDLEGRPLVFTVSDADGHFLLTAADTGDYWINARSLFYWEFSDGPVSLASGDATLVEFRLTPDPTQLDPLVVEGKRRSWKMVAGGYCDREKSGLGCCGAGVSTYPPTSIAFSTPTKWKPSRSSPPPWRCRADSAVWGPSAA